MQETAVSALLLVRNSVDHDARVLRAARVAARALDGHVLVVGVASDAAAAAAGGGSSSVEGVPVLRLSARTPGLTRLARGIQRISPKRRPNARAAPTTASHAIAAGPSPLTLTERARRILRGLSFAWQAISVARQTGPRLVQANDWNTMWAGLAIKAVCGAHLVYDSHELWPDRNGRWERRLWLLASEALFVRAADVVITSSPGYADALAARYRVSRPVVVHNIPEHPHDTGSMAEDRIGLRAASPIPVPNLPARIVYVGGLMPGRGLEQMIDALPLLADIRLCTIGPGPARYRASLVARATAAGVGDRVELRPPVAPEEVQSALAGAAAGLCLIQPICRSYELCLPNKLFEYAAAGVPVLASDMPVIASVVREWGFGEIVAAADSQAIATGLTRLCEPETRRAAIARTHAFALAHTWDREAQTLEEIYARASACSGANREIWIHGDGISRQTQDRR